MKITFDTTEDVEQLRELREFITKLIEKRGYGSSYESAQSAPSPSNDFPTGAFALFSDEPQTSSRPTSSVYPSQNPYVESQQKEVPEDQRDFRVIEY